MRTFLIIFFLLSLPALAALPPQSQEDRVENSELICEAQVVSVSRKKQKVKNGYNYHYTLKLKVLDVRKGELKDEQIEVFCKATGGRPTGWAGPQGQNRIPPEGVIGLFYIRGPAGEFRLLEPNGWEPRPE